MSHTQESRNPEPALPTIIRDLAQVVGELREEVNARLSVLEQSPSRRVRTPDDLPARAILEISSATGEVIDELLHEQADEVYRRLGALRAELEVRLSALERSVGIVADVPMRTPDDLPGRYLLELGRRWGARIEQYVRQAIDRHLTDDHSYGALAELVDNAVAMRFEQYARFLINTGTAQRISEVADRVDDAIDQELEQLATAEQAEGEVTA